MHNSFTYLDYTDTTGNTPRHKHQQRRQSNTSSLHALLQATTRDEQEEIDALDAILSESESSQFDMQQPSPTSVLETAGGNKKNIPQLAAKKAFSLLKKTVLGGGTTKKDAEVEDPALVQASPTA